MLFLSGGENACYDEQRNRCPGVQARRLFARNSAGFRALRRACHGLRPAWLPAFFGDWRHGLAGQRLIIVPVSLYSPAVLAYLRSRTTAPLVNWYWNPVATTLPPEALAVPNSLTLSFDEADCRRHGLAHESTYYFGGLALPQRTTDYDLCFVGADKGRLADLLQLQQALQGLGLRTLFHITGSDTARRSATHAYAPAIDYPGVLERVARSVAILDYVQPGQVGLSQRPMESIFHRRKLVTNDAGIAAHDFYDAENVFILGRDPLQALPDFLRRPFRPVAPAVLGRYDFGQWVERVSARAARQHAGR